LKLEFHGVKVASDAGLSAYREIDEVFGLTDMSTYELTDNRTGRNTEFKNPAFRMNLQENRI